MTNPTWLQKYLENADEVREFPNNSGSLRVFNLGEKTGFFGDLHHLADAGDKGLFA